MAVSNVSSPFSSTLRIPTAPRPTVSFPSSRVFPGLRRHPSCFWRIYALSSNDIKVGINLVVDGAPWRVLEFLHVKPGKGAAFVRTKMRNYITGNTVEKTFRAASSGNMQTCRFIVSNGITPKVKIIADNVLTCVKIEEANVFKETKQYTYKDGPEYVFMDLTTYEEIRLGEKEVGDKTKWLKEGMDCNVLFWNGKVIDFDLPFTVKLKVVDVDPGLRGDTAQGGSKPATLDTGAVVNVPLFVNVDDEILVDTRTGQYMSRA